MATSSNIATKAPPGGSTTSLGKAAQPPPNTISQQSPSILLQQPPCLVAAAIRHEHQPSQQQISTGNEIVTKIPTIRKESTGHESGSGQRKRSRFHDEEQGNTFVKEGLSAKDSKAKKIQVDSLLQQLYEQIEAVFAKGERGKTMINKLAIYDTLRSVGMDVQKLLTAYANAQDEKSALQYQVIQLMTQQSTVAPLTTATSGTAATQTYLQAALTKNISNNIVSGRRLPIPDIPNSMRHAPSEKVLIFKAEKKGTLLTKEQKEQFRDDVNITIGEKLMEEVEVIRPTRNGGHTIIFQTEDSRQKALEAFRNNERKLHIEEERSCIVAPKKKFAKVVCRDPPEDMSMDDILHEFYGKANVHLYQIPRANRETRIVDTRFGWIFEMSSLEAAAIQAQGGRIRFGQARELRVEEYIPMQQCYRCCVFGHNAKDCLSEQEYCRLCGLIGHAGWDCPEKDDRTKWACANCLVNNATKGTNLPTNHAAAQLHKCPCALSHKEERKAQLAAAGIYTSPISEGTLKLIEKPTNVVETQRRNGPQQNGNMKSRRGGRSRSMKRGNQGLQGGSSSAPYAVTALNASNSSSSSSSSFSTHTGNAAREFNESNEVDINKNTNRRETQQYKGRALRVPRPKSYDGWKTVGYHRERPSNEEIRGRDFEYAEGTNSMSQIQMLDMDMQTPSCTTPTIHDG